MSMMAPFNFKWMWQWYDVVTTSSCSVLKSKADISVTLFINIMHLLVFMALGIYQGVILKN